ncbi:Calcium-responsive transcription factor [Channa argus]|uniref:Calcium-responsive transcription factor n=1 Tax=Channa argus TaxID=215402 RepID=A0A6G1Q829_CHAAH|nr:Calcium-responsive transcription factor [Channa argus]
MAEPPTSRVCIRHSRQDVEKLIRELEETTQCKYVSVCNDKNFNDKGWQPSAKNRVFFEKKNDGKSPTITFTGMPFIFIGSMSFECHLGKDRAKKKKERYAQKITSGDNVHKRRRYLAQDTKKIGCPAELKVTRVAMFPDHKILKDSVWERKRAGQVLRSILQENKPVAWENTYYVLVPRAEDHVGHPILGEVACVQEAINPVVEERIKELLRQGVNSVSEMRRRIREFVKSNLYSGDKPLPLTRYRYYTLPQNLRNIMRSARDVVSHSIYGQENLEHLLRILREKDPGDNILGRPHSEGKDFILCYQTQWQQRLLNLYGQDVCLLDAMYKMVRYKLPLYFLWVRTNVCYVVVAVFIVQHETKEALSEALQVLKAWNEGWSPGHFIVDLSTPEISAVEGAFTGCKATLCDFHREKAWGEWIRNVDHGVQNQEVALASLKRTAAADTQQTYEQALRELQESEEWIKNPLFQTWFQTTWLSEEKRWATVFREESLQHNIITNNGIERLNETFKYSHLENYKTSTVRELMTIIVNDFIPQLQKRYMQLNLQYSSGTSAPIPGFLHNRPGDMVMHTKDQMATDLGPEHVTKMSSGIFMVTSEGKNKESNLVTLGSSSALPSCTCEDWKRNRLPCKHFCAGFKAGWTWDDLCPQYRNNPLFTLDPVCFSSRCSVLKPEEKPPQGQDTVQVGGQSNGEDYQAVFGDDNGKDSHGEDLGSEVLPQDEAGPPQKQKKSMIKETPNIGRRRCIELLKAISDSVFFVDNEDFLQSLEITLEDVAMEVKEHTPSAKRAALNSVTKKRKRKGTVGILNSVPLPKRAKHPYAHRLGVSPKGLRHSDIKVPVHQSDTAHLQDQSRTDVNELHLESPERTVSETWCRIGGTVLTLADENMLLSEQWLNDKHINASQSLLREDFPFLEGLHDTVQLPAARAQVHTTADVIQIHHVGQNWLVSASIRGQLQIYDSLLPSSCTPLTLRQQIVALYKTFCKGPDGILEVQIKCTQKQQRAMDCGLFAIANAVSLASGIDPADIQYNLNVMRAHLHTCLTKGKLKMFPHTQRKSRWIVAERCEILSKYCICHQYKEKADMVQCNECQGWYHSSCVNISAAVLEQIVTDGYCCPQCS